MFSNQLCDTCNALAIEDTLQELYESLRGLPTPFHGNHGEEALAQENFRPQLWHPNLSRVSQSSQFCPLCKLALQGLRESRRQLVENTRFSGDWLEPPQDLDDDILSIPWYSETIRLEIVAVPLTDFERENIRADVPNPDAFEINVRMHAALRFTSGGGGQLSSSWDGYGEVKAELRISSPDGKTTSGRFEIDQTIEPNPFSAEVVSRLRFWFNACLSKHKVCSSTLSSFPTLPNRVLQLDPSHEDVAFLYQGKENIWEAQYAALSHCWGSSQPFTTTIRNITSRKRGIEIAKMPRTFQDAIFVCRTLGIKYLWIDSLCIIQDDINDWRRESAQMATIYRDASIVICASNSSADSEGFLHPRKAESFSLETSGLNVKLVPPKSRIWMSTSDPVESEPLASRAWCLQERYLPRRMLSVGREQMYWECPEMVASEDGDCIRSLADRLALIKATTGNWSPLTNIGVGGRSPADINHADYYDWYEVVKQYCRRNMTQPSDRLPALAGLAAALETAHSGQYLAGIWQESLIEGLLWCSAEKEHPLSTPPAYRAPSWSWASVDGFINFPVYNFYDRCKWKALLANFEFLATYVDSHLEFLGEDKFGGIKDGWIKLQGPLLPILCVRDWNKTTHSPQDFVMDPARSSVCDKVLETKISHKGKDEIIYLDGGFGVSESTASRGDLFALLLARLPDPQSSSGVYMDIRFGLILESLSPGKYRRVGIIDGVVKTEKATILSRLRKTVQVHLENYLWKQPKDVKAYYDESLPNLQGPDPFEGLKQTVVTIV